MKHALHTLLAEYRLVFTDSGVVLIFLAGLTIYSMFYPLPYSTEVLREIPVVVVDLDDTALSRKLVRWAEATEEVRFVNHTRDLAEARSQVLNSEAEGIFVIPRGFERDVLRGDRATVSTYVDACYFLIYRQVMTGLYKATATLSAGIEVRRLTAAGFGEEHAMAARDPLPVDSRPLFNPASGYATYVVPGVLILILQQTLLIGIGMVGGTRRERLHRFKDGMRDRHERFLATIMARSTAYFSIYILYPLFYLLVVFRVYDLPRQGNLGEVILFLVPYVLAITYLGMALTDVFYSREIAIPALIFTSVPAIFLLGFAWPIETLPRWLRAFSLLFPCTTGCAGFIRINQMGASLWEVRFEWFVLWGLCAFYLTLSWLLARRRTPIPQDA